MLPAFKLVEYELVEVELPAKRLVVEAVPVRFRSVPVALVKKRFVNQPVRALNKSV